MQRVRHFFLMNRTWNWNSMHSDFRVRFFRGKRIEGEESDNMIRNKQKII